MLYTYVFKPYLYGQHSHSYKPWATKVTTSMSLFPYQVFGQHSLLPTALQVCGLYLNASLGLRPVSFCTGKNFPIYTYRGRERGSCNFKGV